MGRFDHCPANDDRLNRGLDPCYDWSEYHCDGCNMYTAYLMGISKGRYEGTNNEDPMF